MGIAQYTWVRCTTRHVLVNKVFYDEGSKLFSYIQHKRNRNYKTGYS